MASSPGYSPPASTWSAATAASRGLARSGSAYGAPTPRGTSRWRRLGPQRARHSRIGQDVAELLHAATIAIVDEVAIDRLWHAVPAYPTISEVWLRLLETYGRPT
ncbi:hypothetical protein JCM18899A_07520 [Nocardioides sp. AN3]